MGISREQIKEWFEKNYNEGFDYMLIVVDTFDYGDYAVGVPKKEIHIVFDKFHMKNMQRVMEVYNLDMNMEEQLNEKRAWHLPERREDEIEVATV